MAHCEKSLNCGIFKINEDVKKTVEPKIIQLFIVITDVLSLFIQVFYPSDDINVWTLAKLWFGVADSNIHHSAAHVGKNLSI